MSNLIAQACAALAAALGLLAVAGWILQLSLLSSLGPGWVPMAPSTAVLFVLLGTSVHFSARAPLSRAVCRAGIGMGSAGALIGLALFFLSYLGIRLGAEHLGIGIAGTVGGAPIGHMSPATALCFFAGGLSLVASLCSSPDRPGPAMAGFWLAGLMGLASVVFLLAYLFGMPLLYGGGFIPPALTTSLALAALGASLLALSGPRAWPSDRQIDEQTRRASRSFALVFVLMSAGLIAVGGFYFRNQVTQHRAVIERELSGIAELKVSDLVNWRAERIAVATVLHRSAVFAGLARRALGGSPITPARDQLQTWLRQIQEAYGYGKVSLLDAQGAVRISIPEASLGASALERARRALRLDKVILEDFHQDEPGGAPRLSLLAPISGDAGGGRPLGVVMIEIDPRKFLYPLIERWPTLSPSAETLLVRREGDHVLYLNDLRFRKDAALSLRFPLTRTDLPAVKAALGQEGIVEGTDYSGVPVIAAVRPVPGTEWILVARIDTGELFEPLAKTLWLTVILVGALLLLAGVALGLIWRHQRARHYKERVRAAEALRDSERNYRIMFDNAPEGLWMIGPDRRTTEVNRRMCELLGYERDEMLGRDPTDFADVENGRIFKANALVVPGRPTYHFEIALRHRDGHNIPTEVYAANLYDQDGSVRAGLAFVVDLSSRVRFEMELVRLNEELAQREEERKQALSVANRELESFSYSVSHDLGAPLRAISGYSRIIDENHAGSLDEQGRVLLRRVGAAAERMGALIADLLMLSRISRQELNRGPVDLSALARQAAEELQAAEPARMARSSWSIADGVQVVGDAGLLRVALQNLLGNAWKYSSKRDAAHIEFGVTGNGGREAYFVRDNGVGFDMAYAHKLFVAFQRLHGPAEFPGTGIGLATVARVVQRHGGEVWAEGKENEGATFYFTL